MARLTACFALSAVLVLATGICSVTGQTGPIQGQNACTSLAKVPIQSTCDLSGVPPMRILSKAGITSLSIAANYPAANANANDQVVLASTSCADNAQLWINRTIKVGNPEFVLWNTDTSGNNWAIQFPGKPDIRDPASCEVKLVQYDPFGAADDSILWTQDGDVTADGFYKIRSAVNSTWLLDALLFKNNIANVGTPIGVFPEEQEKIKDNVLWRIEGFMAYL